MPRARDTTTRRGYGAGHQKLRAALAPAVATGTVACWRCGHLILPGQAWDLGHDDHDRSVTRGPEHRHRTAHCIGNRGAGAAKGNAMRQPKRQRAVLVNSQRW